MYRQMEQLLFFVPFLSSIALLVGLILTAMMVILSFGRDRIGRPRLFNWGAILFTLSVVLPIACGTYLGILQIMDARGPGAQGIGTIIGLLFALLMMIAPLFFSLGLLLMVIGLTTPYRELVARRRAQHIPERTVVPVPTADTQPLAEPVKPHPLD